MVVGRFGVVTFVAIDFCLVVVILALVVAAGAASEVTPRSFR